MRVLKFSVSLLCFISCAVLSVLIFYRSRTPTQILIFFLCILVSMGISIGIAIKEKKFLFWSIPSWGIGVWLAVFAFVPSFWGIFNIGSVALLVLSLLFFALPFWMIQKKKHKWLWRICMMCYSLLAVFLISLSGLMIHQAYFSPPPATGNYTVVVLGCGLNGEEPSLMLALRLNRAKYYMDENPQAMCIVSGGQGADEVISEALSMYNYMVNDWGVDPSRIIMEDQSTNTRENLRFSMELAPEDSQGFVLATDGFHQYRASITAASVGMEPLYSVSSITPWGLLPSYWIRDLCGIPLTWLEEIWGIRIGNL